MSRKLIGRVKGDRGDKGDKGDSGGHYQPGVTSENKGDYTAVTFDFTKSLADMASVTGKTIHIPHGKEGRAGASPVRGTDYWTPEDKTEIVNAVLAALPVYDGEVVDV